MEKGLAKGPFFVFNTPNTRRPYGCGWLGFLMGLHDPSVFFLPELN